MEEKFRRGELLGRVVVSEERGKRFGEVSDISYVAETGELMNLLVTNTTDNLEQVSVEEDKDGRAKIPFSAVKSVGDFVIVSEEEIA